MKEICKKYATFWVSGVTSIPAITRLMGISPSHKRRMGKKRMGYWGLLALPNNDNTSLSEQVTALLDMLEPRAKALQQLRTNYAVGITCVSTYCLRCDAHNILQPELYARCNKLALDVELRLNIIDCEKEYCLRCNYREWENNVGSEDFFNNTEEFEF